MAGNDFEDMRRHYEEAKRQHLDEQIAAQLEKTRETLVPQWEQVLADSEIYVKLGLPKSEALQRALFQWLMPPLASCWKWAEEMVARDLPGDAKAPIPEETREWMTEAQGLAYPLYATVMTQFLAGFIAVIVEKAPRSHTDKAPPAENSIAHKMIGDLGLMAAQLNEWYPTTAKRKKKPKR